MDDLDLDDLLNSTLAEMEELEKKKEGTTQKKKEESVQKKEKIKEPSAPSIPSGLPSELGIDEEEFGNWMTEVSALMKELDVGGGDSEANEVEESGDPITALYSKMKAQIDSTKEKGPEPSMAHFEDMMSNWMGELGELGGGGEGSDGLFQKAMESLLSKEVLHEPMKDLKEKYPKWLEENKSSISGEEYSRYTKQYEHVCQICDIYESGENMSEILEVMQKMQELGQPPEEILKEMGTDIPGGFDFGGELPDMPDMTGMPDFEEFAQALMSGLGGLGGDQKPSV